VVERLYLITIRSAEMTSAHRVWGSCFCLLKVEGRCAKMRADDDASLSAPGRSNLYYQFASLLLA